MINYVELEKYLLGLSKEDFGSDKLPKGNLRTDIDFFKIKNLKRESIIEYGDFFIVDLVGNDLSVCVLTKRKYYISTLRLVNCKLKKTIVSDCKKVYDDYINGIYVIPKQFYLKRGRGVHPIKYDNESPKISA